MTLTGPSFDTTSSHEKITCVFTDDDGDVTEGFPRGFTRLINGIVVNCKAICPMPLFRKLGSHNLTVVLNDRRYVGEFEVGKLIEYYKCCTNRIFACLSISIIVPVKPGKETYLYTYNAVITLGNGTVCILLYRIMKVCVFRLKIFKNQLHSVFIAS